ncbi:hypothetical protein K438DRAFT_1992425 [Mycena galopus ATCC 62051]|nr:hypothetical protein K438DRAFT_1992425 [Mycena galopus ATCC 62051]
MLSLEIRAFIYIRGRDLLPYAVAFPEAASSGALWRIDPRLDVAWRCSPSAPEIPGSSLNFHASGTSPQIAPLGGRAWRLHRRIRERLCFPHRASLLAPLLPYLLSHLTPGRLPSATSARRQPPPAASRPPPAACRPPPAARHPPPAARVPHLLAASPLPLPCCCLLRSCWLIPAPGILHTHCAPTGCFPLPRILYAHCVPTGSFPLLEYCTPSRPAPPPPLPPACMQPAPPLSARAGTRFLRISFLPTRNKILG